ncbi:MAG TPA: hypothetical protein VG815_07615 [Chloroflexota bacterium]|nr:hypothetical protein [Chloroflexota bacterium]
MKSIRRAAVVLLAVSSLFAGMTAVSFAAQNHATKEKLSIKITDTGTLWGKVSVSPGGKTCKSASCSFQITKGASVTLKETPNNSTTWPFSGWTLNGKNAGKARTLKFKMSKAETAKATYVPTA